jgi:hypothetical protein
VSFQAADLHIVVINSKTGKPQIKELVRIEVDGLKVTPPSSFTDASGRATFNAPADGKELLVDFNGKCATSPVLFPLGIVLSKGLVVKDYCWHKFKGLDKVKAEPGEIVVFYDKLNFFEQLHHMNDAPGVP